MLSTKELDTLAGFYPGLKEKTLREIEISSGLSHETVFRILKGLVKSRHLEEKKVGRTNVYGFVLDEDAYLIFVYYMNKRIKDFGERHNLLSKRLGEFCSKINAFSVILFGSYSKGTETKGSDIDILAVSDDKNAEQIAKTFKTKHNITIRPVVVKPYDFKNIKKDNPPFYSDMVKYGIVFYGMDFFFKEVYRNDKIS